MSRAPSAPDDLHEVGHQPHELHGCSQESAAHHARPEPTGPGPGQEHQAGNDGQGESDARRDFRCGVLRRQLAGSC